MTRRMRLSLIAAATLAAGTGARAAAQEPRFIGRLPDAVRVQVDAVLDSARALGLPTEPLVDRALEGASKGADGARIVAAVRRLAGELGPARDALGLESSPARLTAGRLLVEGKLAGRHQPAARARPGVTCRLGLRRCSERQARAQARQRRKRISARRAARPRPCGRSAARSCWSTSGRPGVHPAGRRSASSPALSALCAPTCRLQRG